MIVANYIPLLLPQSGPNFYRFADDARYEVHIDNDGDAVADWTYRWTFLNEVKNGNTFLYNIGPVDSIYSQNLNVNQRYKLEKINERNGQKTRIFDKAPVAPWNVGKRSFPNYDAVAQQAIQSAGGTMSFAGPRDEPFFVDLHVFDLLGVAARKTTDGVNVMSLVLEIPITDVAKDGQRPTVATAKTSVARHQRLGEPTRRSASSASSAMPMTYGQYHPGLAPRLAARQRGHHPAQGQGHVQPQPAAPRRLELRRVHPRPRGSQAAQRRPQRGLRADARPVVAPTSSVSSRRTSTTAADLLRINIAQGQTNAQSHFPNGRALTDDVTDTLLTVACNNGWRDRRRRRRERQAVRHVRSRTWRRRTPATPEGADHDHPQSLPRRRAVVGRRLHPRRSARKAPPPRALPVLVSSTQADLAKALDDAERLGTWLDVKSRWQGQRLRWTVTRYPALCRSAESCNVAAFPVQRPAKHGWLPTLDLAPDQFRALEARCGKADACELTVEGTLSKLEVSDASPTNVTLSNVRIVDAS